MLVHVHYFCSCADLCDIYNVLRSSSQCKAIPLLQNGDVAENVLEGNLNPRKATVPVLNWACAACAPNSVVLCQDGTMKVVSSTRLELKEARSCTAASAVTSDDNGNR